MKHEILIIVVTIVFTAVLVELLEEWLGNTWQLVVVAILVFLPLRLALYRYRRARGIKDPLDDGKWYWP